MKASRKVGGKSVQSNAADLPQNEWNFSDVPKEQLEACCFWEYARESESILRFAREIPDEPPLHAHHWSDPGLGDIMRVNPRLASLLAQSVPCGLAETTWKDHVRRVKTVPIVPANPALKVASPFDVNLWNNREDPQFRKYMEDEGTEIVSFRVDWNQSPREITKCFERCFKTAQTARKKEGWKPKRFRTGRHSGSAEFGDALRRLGAIRLLAHYGTIAKAVERARACNVPIYPGRIDGDGRPTNKTPWRIAKEGVRDQFHKMFKGLNDEEPVAWTRCIKNRSKK